MADRTSALFHRWIRITIGLFFMGVSVYYKEWMPAVFGVIFILLGITNSGCYGTCNTPLWKKTGRSTL